jgi:hypothetical protein
MNLLDPPIRDVTFQSTIDARSIPQASAYPDDATLRQMLDAMSGTSRVSMGQARREVPR